MKSALLIVDMQNDFMPGGALAVPEANMVTGYINALMPNYTERVATRDWHPQGHVSFASTHNKEPGDSIAIEGVEQRLWPDHCVQHTPGADFVPELEVDRLTKIIDKGTRQNLDSYSGFFDNAHKQKTELDAYLTEQGVDTLDIVGVALDYCVLFTALDAAALGYSTALLARGTKAVNLSANDGARAIKQMRTRGVRICY